MNQIEKATIIKKGRNITIQNDTPELQNQRKKLMDWLLVRNFDLKVMEMYSTNGEVIKSKKQFPQYFFEYKYANTRTKTLNESRWETDKLPFEKAMKVICEVCLSLIRNKYHFVVFYAEGQRCPHIILYDLEELELLTPFQREKAQVQFWRKMSPFSIQWLDVGVNSDGHYVPMEFVPHYKYGTPFNLVFEYIPETEKKKDKIILKEDVVATTETKEERHQRYIQGAKEFEELRKKILEESERRRLKEKEILDNVFKINENWEERNAKTRT